MINCRIKFLKAVLLIVALPLALLVLMTGCKGFGVIVGKGPVVTRSFDFSGFSRIEVRAAFEVDIVPSENYSVAITGHENLFDYILVEKIDDTLIIRMQQGTFTPANPRIAITLPAVTYLKLSGASHGSIKGFVSNNDLTLRVDGASSLETVVAGGKGDVEISGASKLNGSLTLKDATVQISGASRMEIGGYAQTLDIEVSGASTADMFSFATQDAKTDVSGASTLNLTVNGKLDGRVSGASTLNYKGTASLGKTDISGASSLHKK